jgi:hypothetical protein
VSESVSVLWCRLCGGWAADAELHMMADHPDIYVQLMRAADPELRDFLPMFFRAAEPIGPENTGRAEQPDSVKADDPVGGA